MPGALLKSMRPKQWIKNLLVFAAVVFSRNLFHLESVLRTFGAFLAFSLVASAVYIINDLVDRENDRRHPTKKNRPIASGRLGTGAAAAGAAGSILLGLGGGLALDWRFGVLLGGYFLMQLGYSFRLKQVVVLDVMIVAAGFALRAIAGVFVVHVNLSPWLFVCTILAALFVAVAKRRHELLFLEGGGISHRTVLGKYSETLLDQMMAVATSATVIAYCLYTIAPETVAKFGTSNLILTVPFMLYGVFRYLYLVYRKEMGGAPEKVFLTDLPLIIDIALYVASAVLIVYLRI
jgi:4-hydroxybenzoate polyprenyltransferase